MGHRVASSRFEAAIEERKASSSTRQRCAVFQILDESDARSRLQLGRPRPCVSRIEMPARRRARQTVAPLNPSSRPIAATDRPDRYSAIACLSSSSYNERVRRRCAPAIVNTIFPYATLWRRARDLIRAAAPRCRHRCAPPSTQAHRHRGRRPWRFVNVGSGSATPWAR